MLVTLIVILIVLWLLGVLTGTGIAIAGSALHLLLVIAVILIILRLLRGQSVL